MRAVPCMLVAFSASLTSAAHGDYRPVGHVHERDRRITQIVFVGSDPDVMVLNSVAQTISEFEDTAEASITETPNGYAIHARAAIAPNCQSRFDIPNDNGWYDEFPNGYFDGMCFDPSANVTFEFKPTVPLLVNWTAAGVGAGIYDRAGLLDSPTNGEITLPPSDDGYLFWVGVGIPYGIPLASTWGEIDVTITKTSVIPEPSTWLVAIAATLILVLAGHAQFHRHDSISYTRR